VKGYFFFPGKASMVSNLGTQFLKASAQQLAMYCSQSASCAGFSSDGWLKSVVLPPGQWTASPSQGPCDGLFVKGKGGSVLVRGVVADSTVRFCRAVSSNCCGKERSHPGMGFQGTLKNMSRRTSLANMPHPCRLCC